MANPFSKQATTNAILIIEIAFLIVLLVRYSDRRRKPASDKPQTEQSVATIAKDSLRFRTDNVASPESEPTLRPFDPNTVTYEELRAIGMSRREAVSLIKFRATGKVFSIKEDVALCYNISDSAYSVLAPYIVIGEEYRIKPTVRTKHYDATPKREYSNKRDTAKVVYLTPTRFRIDTVSEAYLRAIGAFTKRQAEAFIRWRDRSGFRDMEEVRKCYVVSDSVATALEPYIIFPERKPVEPTYFERPLDINRADSARLIKVAGIGPKTVLPIIIYRNRLGGFYSVEQIAEVQGVTDSNYEMIAKQIYCDSTILRKIDVNACTANELMHPYIKYTHVRKLMKHRQLTGGWDNIEQMVKQGIFTRDEAARLKPYFTFGKHDSTEKSRGRRREK